VDPRSSLDAVAKRKNHIIAPAGNQSPLIQPIAQVIILTELNYMKYSKTCFQRNSKGWEHVFRFRQVLLDTNIAQLMFHNRS
jgi:hypothetical protein